jgi:uncharacterized protein YdaT
MDTFSPIIITSRKAKKDFERIKTHSIDIVKRNEEHEKRVSAYRQSKLIEKQQKNQMKIEHQKRIKEEQAKREQARNEQEKNRNEMELKQQEMLLKHLNG